MSCLDETTIARLLDRTLTRPETALVIAHIDGCADCRSLISALAPGQLDEPVSDQSGFAQAFAPLDGPAHALDIAPDELPLLRLRRYKVANRIKRGERGEVYAAHDQELGRDVAIKLLRPVAASDAARIVREAGVLTKLAYPNVRAILDAGTIGDHVFISMEPVRGGTLRDWLAVPRSVQPSIDAIVHVMADVGRGLAAAHACGLVHRDVTPEHILFTSDGRVTVSDFGLAAAMTDDLEPPLDPGSAPVKTPTRVGELVGTPAYMAPEQLAAGRVDARTDQFAFCVTLHEAVFGVGPFAGSTLEPLVKAVCSNTRRAPPAVWRHVPTWLVAVIDRGLAPDPGARFATMDALVAALTAAVRRRHVVRVAMVLAGLAVVVAALLLR